MILLVQQKMKKKITTINLMCCMRYNTHILHETVPGIATIFLIMFNRENYKIFLNCFLHFLRFVQWIFFASFWICVQQKIYVLIHILQHNSYTSPHRTSKNIIMFDHWLWLIYNSRTYKHIDASTDIALWCEWPLQNWLRSKCW